jgi:hypothetical protein
MLNGLQGATNWTQTEDYGCYYGNLAAGANITLGTHATTTDDPLYLDQPNADFRLDGASPCINTASDGSNRGAWQSGALWWQELPSAVRDVRPAMVANGIVIKADNPLTGQMLVTVTTTDASLTVYDVQGNLVRTMAGRSRLVWDGRDELGKRVDGGLYFYVVNAGGNVYRNSIVVAR